jgi:futalosine hydrolase
MKQHGRVLWVAATPGEIEPLGCSSTDTGWFRDLAGDGHDVLVTGVGMVATAYHLGRILERESYRLAINIGLAGTFYPDLFPVGAVVEVVHDTFADLGAEDHGRFLDVFGLGLMNMNEAPFHQGFVSASIARGDSRPWLHAVGATVNTVHGDAQSILNFMQRSKAQVETMEGAAFFFSCALAGVQAFQFRAISNVVEPRNRASWKIPEALAALESFLKENKERILQV